jgi:hypothetical protein
MSKETRERINEIIQWASYHKKNVHSQDLRKVVEFQGIMLDELLTLLTMVYRDMRIDVMNLAGLKQGVIALPPNMGNAIPFKRKFDA